MHDKIHQLIHDLKTLKDSHSLPGELLPNCFRAMQGEFLEYRPREKLVARFPVQEQYLNPIRVLQGGFLTAAFDNVFGPLGYAASGTLCSTIDLQTHFLRAIDEGDVVTITALVVTRGSTLMHLRGEAHNSIGKLVATASANMIIQRS